MDDVKIQLAQYQFTFRRLLWKEEFGLKPGKKDPRRVLLATALVDISGLKVNDLKEALRVIAEIPRPILERVYVIYRGSLTDDRQFKTRSLYKAPEPQAYQTRVYEAEEAAEQVHDVVMERAEQQFGKQELEEAKEVERQVMEGARKRGTADRPFPGASRRMESDEEHPNPLGGWKQ